MHKQHAGKSVCAYAYRVSVSGGIMASAKVTPACNQQQQQSGGKKKKKKLTNAELRLEKQKRRKLNKKKNRQQQQEQQEDTKQQATKQEEKEDVVVEYVTGDEEGEGGGGGGGGAGKLLESLDASVSSEFEEIFLRFKHSGDATVKGLRRELALAAKREGGEEEEQKQQEEQEQEQKQEGKDEKREEEEQEDHDEKVLSKKQKKLLAQKSISELKQLCRNPEAVEVWDVTAQDPELLVSLKSYRNTVPVPMHWSQKRKFLQGKRGIEKPPFKLPEFISATGIEEMRGAAMEKEEEKKLKTKTRERLNPKMGKIEIDYQVLHDAFFKYQKKPKLSRFGDLYYEGKEFEVELKQKRPGRLSREAKIALGMINPEQDPHQDGEDQAQAQAQAQAQVGASKKSPMPVLPPPWLVNMQRYGPPPSYPSLLIPGLNAPIPEGASFGYHPGGWGKPPVDEMGNPLYGDVFGIHSKRGKGQRTSTGTNEQGGKHLTDLNFEWGGMEEEEESESEYEEVDPEDLEEDDMEDEEEEEEEEEEEKEDDQGGMEAPINLRKDLQSSETPVPELYKVLPEVGTSVKTSQFMGSEKVYDMSGGGKQTPAAAAVNDKNNSNNNNNNNHSASGKATPKPEKEKKKEKAFKF